MFALQEAGKDAADGTRLQDGSDSSDVQMGVTAMQCDFMEGSSVVEVVRAPIKGLPRMQVS